MPTRGRPHSKCTQLLANASRSVYCPNGAYQAALLEGGLAAGCVEWLALGSNLSAVNTKPHTSHSVRSVGAQAALLALDDVMNAMRDVIRACVCRLQRQAGNAASAARGPPEGAAVQLCSFRRTAAAHQPRLVAVQARSAPLLPMLQVPMR